MAPAPKAVVGHGQVDDQAPAARCVLEVAADLNVAAPLACTCRYAVLRADLDYFGGLEDLRNGVLKTPLPCEITFKDDPLRILRAIRFMITKNFEITGEMHSMIKHFDYEVFMAVVSAERIREELLKCFKHDTLRTIELLTQYPYLFEYICMTGLWFKPTLESR